MWQERAHLVQINLHLQILKEEFENKSVFFLFCFFFICNRSIFAGKDIFIAGGGHSAADWAISLSEIANKKNLVYKRNQFRDAKENLRQLKVIVETGNTELVTVCQHGYIILNRSNN